MADGAPDKKEIVVDGEPPKKAPLRRLPKGILPEGIHPPPGTDIMQFCRDLAESGADFAEQFNRESETFHNGITTPVPLNGGERCPDTMGGQEAANWQALPEQTVLAIEEDFGPEYNKAMDMYKRLGECKKSISVLNKPVEMAMKLRVQYKDAAGDNDTAWRSRLKGAENDRDGALNSATATIFEMANCSHGHVVSDRTKSCVQDVVERGKFEFVDKEVFGEYMQVLQRANQAIFMDQKKLLAEIKALKKAAKSTFDATAAENSAAPTIGGYHAEGGA
jgi:hypothetical protein